MKVKELFAGNKSSSAIVVTDVDEKMLCPKCRSPLVIKTGRYGNFYSCSDFPRCRYARGLHK